MRYLSLLVLITSGLAGPLTLQTRVPLPGVAGRIDHLAADVAGRRLFVAALGNNTIEVITSDKRTATIRGPKKPQGLLYDPGSGLLFAASGDDGFVRAYDGSSLKPVGERSGFDDADNVRWDAQRKQVIVGHGDGALAIFDKNLNKVAEIRLPAHPESFQIDSATGRAFINVPDAHAVLLADLAKRTVAAKWPLSVAANYPMAFDAAHHRVFIGARRPAKLVVLDSESGRAVAALDCVGDTDDLFYDAQRGRVYVIGGEGAVSIFHQDDADHYRLEAKVPTAPRARTGLFVADWNQLLIAAPQRGSVGAQLLVYRLE